MQLYTQSQIGSRVARIVRVAGKVDAELHVVLCSILDHTREHGDYTALVPLMNGLPNGQRKQGIVAWLKHFSGGQLTCSQNADTGAWQAKLKPQRDQALFDITGAMAVTFGDFTKEPAAKTLSVEALIKMLEAKATNTELNKDGTPKVSVEARTLASNMVAAIRSGKIVAMNPAAVAF